MPIRILLVEPNESDRYWVQLVLREIGISHTVFEFPSAIFALEELRAGTVPPVDFVIVNVVLPVLEIEEAVERLRGETQLAASRYAVTVLDEHDCRRVPDGCARLVKPVSVEALRGLMFAT